MIRLLVVDDSALMRKLMGAIFEAEGDFEIRYARNGLEGLDLVKAWGPQVVTLDVNMPVMDGLTCLSRIMVEAPCPVVMVSSRTQAGAEATLEAMHLGAVDFVAKPDGTVSLSIDRIRPVLVEKVRAAASAKLRRSLRLRERVRHQLGTDPGASGARATGKPGEPGIPRPGGDKGGLVVIGASTGGPQALEAILSQLPGDLPWPVLVAQHMPATFTGVFAKRLGKLCALHVAEVTGPMPLQAGCAYIGRGDGDLLVAQRPSGLIALPAPAAANFRWHPSVDRLVDSAMRHVEPRRVLGVLLTGMGDDGAAAMTRLRSIGGRTLAQDEGTAVVWGMPGQLVARGGAEATVPLPDIAAAIVRMIA